MLPEELLHRIVAGDANAFRELYEMYKGKVYNTSLSYVHRTEEAEEVTQDVFVEIHQSASKFKGKSSVGTWIYRITVNKCIDKLRYHKRQKRFALVSSIFHKDTGEIIYDPATFHHPGVQYEDKEKAAFLFSAIGQLPESQQTAFILKQIEGVPQSEIADIMELSEKAVESLLQRAKANLRKILGYYYKKTKE